LASIIDKFTLVGRGVGAGDGRRAGVGARWALLGVAAGRRGRRHVLVGRGHEVQRRRVVHQLVEQPQPGGRQVHPLVHERRRAELRRRRRRQVLEAAVQRLPRRGARRALRVARRGPVVVARERGGGGCGGRRGGGRRRFAAASWGRRRGRLGVRRRPRPRRGPRAARVRAR